MSDNVINDGIKETRTPNEHDFQATMDWLDHNNTTNVPLLINEIVNTGIKKTEGGIHFYEGTTDNVIKNGIKNTQPHVLEIINPIDFEPTIMECKRMNEVNSVLEKGIKETRAMDEWVNTENIINKVIDNGVLEKGIKNHK
jgi:hypothetical protein